MTAAAGVSPEKVVEVAEVIVGEFQKLTTDTVGEEELTKVKDYSIGTFRLGLEDTMSMARWVGDQLLTLGEVQEIEDVVGKMQAVTAADVQRMAQKLFIGNEMAIALTGPKDETKSLLKLASK